MAIDAVFEAFYAQATVWINGAARGVESLPVSYAFGAGMLATLNPCGFIMLPAFGAFFLTTGSGAQDVTWYARAARAVWMGLLITAAFIVIFALAGVLVWAGGRALIGWSRWAGLAVGVALTAFGLYQLAGRRSVFAGLAAGVRMRRSRSAHGVVLFGAAYGICSLGCTLPAFLIVAGSVFIGNPDLAGGTWRFVEYALGMGFVLTAVTLGIAFARESALRLAGRVMPAIEPAANALLVLAGLYIIWYWTKNGVLL